MVIELPVAAAAGGPLAQSETSEIGHGKSSIILAEEEGFAVHFLSAQREESHPAAQLIATHA